ncbi:EAL domain-containing protein [Oxalobacter sp. OttesenSCG-928-P03]|nr:EAL domain-containing protein [Oxalobacter sp. OttesenSCG-928-P03]
MKSSRKNLLVQWLTAWIETPYLVAVRDGLALTMPIILAGTIAILVNSFPLASYQDFMHSLFGDNWKLFGQYIYTGTFGIMSVFMIPTIGYSLSENYNERNPLDRVSPVVVALVVFSSVFCILEPINNNTALPLQWMGVYGLLLSIVTAILSWLLFRFLLRFPKLRVNFYTGSSAASMTQVMNTLFPAVITILFFAGFKALTKVLGIADLHETTYRLLSMPFHALGGHYLGTAVLYGFVRHFLWFFGIHGSNVLEPVMRELYIPASLVNIENFRAGLEPLYILTKPFFDCYTSIGGAGSTSALLIALLLRHRDNGVRKIAKISIIPSLFNINEILLFGLPIVLNPVFIAPFILVPIVNTIISYYACMFGIVPMTVHDVAWNIPLFVNAYLSTGSVSAIVLQLINLLVGVAIYLPFVVLDDRIKTSQFHQNFRKLLNLALEESTVTPGQRLLNRPGAVGLMAYNLANDLRQAVDRKELYVEYQPQVDSDTGRVYGVESLARWHHPTIGRIPPPLFITISEDTGYILPLGLWVLEESVRQAAEWRKAGLTDLVMSVNVSAKQLEDPELPEKILEIIQRHALPVENLKLEVTESIALTTHMAQSGVLARLNEYNIRLAIDDFGMGHSSLTYLKRFSVASLKVDSMLSRDVLASRSSSEIVATIAELCRSLNIELIAEFVDNEPQLLKLRSLGCHNVQGYFYSPPLRAEEAFAFISQPQKAYGTADLNGNTAKQLAAIAS